MSDPDVVGYSTSKGNWAAVPYGSEYMVLNEGRQGEVFPDLPSAKAFIAQQLKAHPRVSAPRKPKKSKNQPKGTLTHFLK